MEKQSGGTIPERYEFERYTAEIFSRGKTQALNEDLWLVSPTTIAVVDGATAKTIVSFEGKTSGQLASELVASILNRSNDLVGIDLVTFITKSFNSGLEQVEAKEKISQIPQSRPSAVFVAAKIIGDQLIITQVGDVAFRVNGDTVYSNPMLIDEKHSRLRAEAIKKTKKDKPDIPISELLTIGRNAIIQGLSDQIRLYQNNPEDHFGYGAIDGADIPEKFIKVYTFPIREIKVLEVFSDGYFKVATQTSVQSWENAFMEVELLDPYKIGKYPSTKGSSHESQTDDRTVIVASFK